MPGPLRSLSFVLDFKITLGPSCFRKLSSNSNPIAHVIRFKVCRSRGAQYKTSPRFLRTPLSLSFAKWSPRTGIMDFIFSFVSYGRTVL